MAVSGAKHRIYKQLKSRRCLATLLGCTSLAPALALAQVAPQHQAVDEFGMDLLSLTPDGSAAPDVSIGTGEGALAYQRRGLSQAMVNGLSFQDFFMIPDWPNSMDWIVNLGDHSIRFTYDPVNGLKDSSGSGYTINGLIVTSPDGTTYEFGHESGTTEQNDIVEFLTKIRKPNGAEISANWAQQRYMWGNGEITTEEFHNRIQSVENNSGNIIHFDYAYDVPSGVHYLGDPNSPNQNWTKLVSVKAINRAVDPCDPYADNCDATTVSWPVANFSRPNDYSLTVTSPGNISRTYTIGPNGADYTVTGSADENMVYSGGYLQKGGRTLIYGSPAAGTITRTEGANVTTFVLGPAGGPYTRIASVTNPLNQTTSYTYDNKNRVTQVTMPEGNKVIYTYDARGNVSEERHVSKTPGTPPDIVLTSDFDLTCTNPVKCNKPNWTRDALNNQTDFTYDPNHGGVTTVTQPAAAAGEARPQVRYTYSSKQAYYKDANGSVVPSNKPIQMLTSVSTCRSGTSCTGTVQETKTTIDYGPQTAGVANNLVPIATTVAAGDGSLSSTTAIGYDAVGNAITIDGPLAGTSDITRLRYDAARRYEGKVTADPDAGGPRLPIAERITYGSQGQVIRTEVGNVVDQGDGWWANIMSAQQVNYTHDASLRPIKTTLTAGGTTYAVTQQSYHWMGGVECTAVRVDPSQWNSQTDACDAQTTSTNGPDRITRTEYDALGRVEIVREAFDAPTFGEAVTQTNTYSPNGQLKTVKDGENNLTTYEYDGHDRLEKTRFPVTTQGAATSSSGTTGDYEKLTYNANSQVIERRLRDGQLIGYTIDNLGRVKLKNLPGTEADVTYGYDLNGRLTSAGSLTFNFDGLGRLSSAGTVGYGYDPAGRRTSMTYPGSGLTINYDYDILGNTLKIRENGATSGVGVLASYTYDDLGRRDLVTFGNGSVQDFTYDAISRLQSLTNNLSGADKDLTQNFNYNYAGQIASVTRINPTDAYAWTSHVNSDRGYNRNGLNQYTSTTGIGGVSLSYDARGNLVGSGSNAYGYTSENQLISAPGAATLSYDELGRLKKTAKGTNASIVKYEYDGSDLIAEWGWGNGSGAPLLRRYVHGPGADEPIVWYEGSGITDRRFLMADERGSIVSVTDSGGLVLGLNKYDEFGIPQRDSQGQITNLGRFGYTGQTWLSDVGMWHYKARTYSPTMGRFMQTDPIDYDDGLNWYNYVGSDPVNATDPSGLACNDGYANSYCDPSYPEDDGPPIDVCSSSRRICDFAKFSGRWALFWPSGGFRFSDDQDRIRAALAMRNRENPFKSKLAVREAVCWALSHLPNGNSLSIGGDIQAYGGIGGYLGGSVSIDRNGTISGNFSRGWGAGFGGNGGLSLNYGTSPSPGRTKISHIQGGAGYGWIGGSASYSKAEGWNRSGGLSVGPRVGFAAGSVDGTSSTIVIGNVCK